MRRLFSASLSRGLAAPLSMLALATTLAAAPALADTAKVAADAAQDLTVEQLIAKNNKARGGQAAWSDVDAVKIQGKMSMAGMQAPFTIFFKRPNRMRMEMQVQGTEMVQGFDGSKAWAAVPLLGQMEARELGEAESTMLRRQADFEGPLFGAAEKGHTVELLGQEEIDGQQAYKLKVQLADGDESTLYLDAETFLEMRQVGKVEAQGQTVETEILFDDWRAVGDLTLQHSLEMRPKGAPAGQKILFDTVEILSASEVSDDLFAMPSAAGS